MAKKHANKANIKGLTKAYLTKTELMLKKHISKKSLQKQKGINHNADCDISYDSPLVKFFHTQEQNNSVKGELAFFNAFKSGLLAQFLESSSATFCTIS